MIRDWSSGSLKFSINKLSWTNLWSTLTTTVSPRGLYYWKFNPHLFAGLCLPRTKIRPKDSEGVQNTGHFWTQHPWKPLYGLIVWPYLWNLIFWIFGFFGVSCLIGGQLATSHQLFVVIYAHGKSSARSHVACRWRWLVKWVHKPRLLWWKCFPDNRLGWPVIKWDTALPNLSETQHCPIYVRLQAAAYRQGWLISAKLCFLNNDWDVHI